MKPTHVTGTPMTVLLLEGETAAAVPCESFFVACYAPTQVISSPPVACHLRGSTGSGAVKACSHTSLVSTFKMWFMPDDRKRKRKVASDDLLCYLLWVPSPAPSHPVRCLVRSSASVFPPAAGVIIVLEHMGKAGVRRDGGEENRINNLRSPISRVAALVPVGAAWRGA